MPIRQQMCRTTLSPMYQSIGAGGLSCGRVARRSAKRYPALALWAEIIAECGGATGLRALIAEHKAVAGVFLVSGIMFEEESLDRIMALPADVQQLLSDVGIVARSDIDDGYNDPGAFYEMLYED